MDSLNGFVVFVQVAETRSFVAAGRLLGISASAIGKSVARLEDRLGVRLFHRSTRSITLTAEGALFLERSRRILAEIEAAQLELSQASTAPRGRLRVSLPLVSSLVLPVLGEFMRAYPEIELDLDFTDQLVDVIEEGFDAVVRTGAPADSRLSARRLGAFGYLLVASPGYLAQRGTPRVPEDLLQHSCLHYRYPHSGKLEPWVLRRAAGAPELQLPTSMICNNIETRLCFALQGLGIAYLPEFSIREPLADGRLQPVLADCMEHTNVFHVLWPASKHPSPKLRALVDFLCARVFPQEQPGQAQDAARTAAPKTPKTPKTPQTSGTRR
ncbi:MULTISPECIES: LysR family transcriptional regulator [unclassified Delftia]|uniref:LysR family transcriptional regulator n=1 Tax=unclassified Delftia TaxID=2613839 RepID=UPI001902BD99|nr:MULTISPECIES: LysR family transcriptional regulator [unclassified Delftia]MBK0115488.1 LysR family transcriptional regulator [Delftia sp. S65]MBK0119103.1 LysR family transcriptional regulator [Delftia sp. S67]MBK0130425.1 LysR family transcriptional regulator [Delftia sp. S66]